MKDKITVAVIGVLSIGLAAYCGYAFCTNIDLPDFELYAKIPVYILSVFLSIFIIDFMHEGAHLIVGLILSMGVTMPKIRLFRSSSVELNPKGEKRIKGRFIATCVAGPVITLAVVVLGAFALFVPSVSIIFAILLPYSFYLFMLNILPVQLKYGKTDGEVLWDALANRPTAQVMFAILSVQGMLNRGVMLQDIPEELLMDLPQLPEDDINFIILTQLRCEYYEARGNDSEAYKYFLRYQQIYHYLPEDYVTR